jgi:hypothetical protein
MSGTEKQNWKRFFMITGPTGDERMDAHFAHIRQIIVACHGNNSTVGEHLLTFDYKDHFRDEDDFESIEEEIVNNVEKDMETLERRFGGRRSGVSGGFAAPTPCLLLGKKEDYENPKTDEG